MTCLAKSCFPNTHALDLRCSVKPASFLNNATDIKQSSRTSVETSVVDNCINGKVNMKDHKFAEGLKEKNQESRNDVDLEFLCTPSFDLGIWYRHQSRNLFRFHMSCCEWFFFSQDLRVNCELTCLFWSDFKWWCRSIGIISKMAAWIVLQNVTVLRTW